MQLALIRLYRCHRQYGTREITQFDDFGAHAELLHSVGINLHYRAACGRLTALIDRHVVHSHRVLFRHRRSVRQPHRVTVVEKLPLRLIRLIHLRSCGVIRINGDIVHAVRRFLGHRRRVRLAHRVAVIKNLALGRDCSRRVSGGSYIFGVTPPVPRGKGGCERDDCNDQFGDGFHTWLPCCGHAN